MYKLFSIDFVMIDVNSYIVVYLNKGEIVMFCIYFMLKFMFLRDE